MRSATNTQRRDKRRGRGQKSRFKKLSPHLLTTVRWQVVSALATQPPRVYFTLRQAQDVATVMVGQTGRFVVVVQEVLEPGGSWRLDPTADALVAS
jgi:hypothetical protein